MFFNRKTSLSEVKVAVYDAVKMALEVLAGKGIKFFFVNMKSGCVRSVTEGGDNADVVEIEFRARGCWLDSYQREFEVQTSLTLEKVCSKRGWTIRGGQEVFLMSSPEYATDYVVEWVYSTPWTVSVCVIEKHKDTAVPAKWITGSCVQDRQEQPPVTSGEGN